jgi:hypothetical protein
MLEITNLIDAGLAHVPPIHMLLLEDVAWAHEMIDTGHTRGKLVRKGKAEESNPFSFTNFRCRSSVTMGNTRFTSLK